MIISRTPLRVSLAGGGTDIQAFWGEEPGAVLSTAINKSVYFTVNKKFDDRVRASYSKTETVDHASQIKHALVREALKMVGIDHGIEIASLSDIPSSGTGLGSSSSYTVGLLCALYGFLGKIVSPHTLAEQACQIEIEILGNPIGKQDQYAAAFGGFQFYQFLPSGRVLVDPVLIPKDRLELLERNFLLLYTGITRSANIILNRQVTATADATHRATLRLMRDQAMDLRQALTEGDTRCMGPILDQGWQLKRSLAEGITNPEIEAWYETAKSAGALGGKILGAGGGGFLLLYAPQGLHARIIAALPDLRPVPFQFEPQGSRIIFVEN